jgi:lipid-binding SYLF domain-containing protein
MKATCFATAFVVLAALTAGATTSFAQEKGKTAAAELTAESKAALQDLYAKVPLAKGLGPQAVAILVFPEVTKAGLGIGGQYGEGALLRKGNATAFYKTTGASFGLQAGAQKYGYAMFFLSEETLKYLDKVEGFEVGVGPSVVVADQGLAKSTTTTTVKSNIYAFIFDQKGAMAALGIQGNKITKIKK